MFTYYIFNISDSILGIVYLREKAEWEDNGHVLKAQVIRRMVPQPMTQQ